MARLILSLLGLLALIVAPLPAAAIASPATVAAAGSGHCAESAGAADRDEEPAQDQDEHPCCKSSAGGCCPVGASFGSPASPRLAGETTADRRLREELVPPGSAVPPLMEPPTLA